MNFREYLPSPSDLSVIVIAAVLAICGLYLMLGPSPISGLANLPKKPAQSEQARESIIYLNTAKPKPEQP